MPRKILNKIIRHLDTSELESFTLDQNSGELCYLAKDQGKTLKIPDTLCRDFFLAIEKSLNTQNENSQKRFRLFSSKGKVSITLDTHSENGYKKIKAEFEKPEKLINFKQLGFNLAQQKIIKKIINQKKGLIVAGLPAGEGLSNLIYALTSEIKLEEKSAYLLSTNQEYRIEGLNFIPLQTPYPSDLNKKLSWLEKRDTEIIVVPEIYDRQTAYELTRLANAGHLVIAGCRSRDAFSILNSFLKAGPTKEILENFSLIISGRRASRLCPYCAEKYQPSAEEISLFARRFSWKKSNAINLIPKKLLRSIGCSKCHHRGRLGQIGLYETLVIKPSFKTQENLLEIRRQAFDSGYQPLIINALEAAKNGLISLQEIIRLKI